MTTALELTRDLCGYTTGVVAAGNAPLFARLAQELPFELHRWQSGETFNGWVVPDDWTVEHATISRGGEVLFDGTVNPLAVGRYSRSFQGTVDWSELKRHLSTNPDLPEAYVFHCMWQYRPWDADWALSVPYATYRELEAAGGRYEVDVRTAYAPSEMLVATADLPGDGEETIVLQAHSCHPHMANDGFAGVAVLVRVMQWLATRERRRHRYRLVVGPEHLGTVFYLRDLPPAELDRIVCGVFAEMPGTRGPVKVASSFSGGTPIDLALANAARHHARAHELVGWRKGAGNDETVWEAPGYEVPFPEVTRSEDLMAPFREYHTNLDTPDLMDPAQLAEFEGVLRAAIEALEDDAVALRRFDGLVALSSPRYRLYKERADPAVDKELPEDSETWGELLDSLLRYFDGQISILEIAQRHDLPFSAVRDYVHDFAAAGLVDLQPRRLGRASPRRTGREAGA